MTPPTVRERLDPNRPVVVYGYDSR
jgi:hypothetical protein